MKTKFGRKALIGIIAYQVLTKGILIPAYYIPIDRFVDLNMQQAKVNNIPPSKWDYLAFWRLKEVWKARNPEKSGLERTIR